MLAFALAACGHVNTTPDAATNADSKPIDASTAPDASLTFTMANSWTNCPVMVDCEDVYDFDVSAAAHVTVSLTMITSSSLPRLGLYAGSTTSGIDLFTGQNTAACGTATDVDFSQGPTLVSPGHYRAVVGRDWGKSSTLMGTYTVTISADTALANVQQTADDQASSQGHCP